MRRDRRSWGRPLYTLARRQRDRGPSRAPGLAPYCSVAMRCAQRVPEYKSVVDELSACAYHARHGLAIHSSRRPFTLPAVLHCVLLYSLHLYALLAVTKFSSHFVISHFPCRSLCRQSIPCPRDPTATHTRPTTSPSPAPLPITISLSVPSSPPPPPHRDNSIVIALCSCAHSLSKGLL